METVIGKGSSSPVSIHDDGGVGGDSLGRDYKCFPTTELPQYITAGCIDRLLKRPREIDALEDPCYIDYPYDPPGAGRVMLTVRSGRGGTVRVGCSALPFKTLP